MQRTVGRHADSHPPAGLDALSDDARVLHQGLEAAQQHASTVVADDLRSTAPG
ncbi:MAG: hypothetical protein Q8O33_03770 [Pseudomonadota bacterium]|nr:hypothetical protein [Pseudomonadota bacterium]